jgi:hypothetical protein
MDKDIIYKHIITSLYKMLCWREEGKHWITIYDELLSELTFNEMIDKDIRGNLVLKIITLKYIDFTNFRQTIFEVINYVDTLRGV